MNRFTFLSIALAASLAVSCNEAPQWSPSGDRIMTVWGESLEPTDVLPEYPRPQMVRDEWVNLNGLWKYAVVPAESPCPEEFDGHILVPFAAESALSGVGRTVTENDALWYVREFRVPKKWAGERIMLNFGAVDWKAEVFVDGQMVGEHTGGYAPFCVDVTDALERRRNHELKVKVTDRTDKWFQPRGKQVSNPNSIWYTAVTGIWQTVWMEPVPEEHIVSYMADADLERSVLNVDVDYRQIEGGETLKVALYDNGVLVDEAETDGSSVALNVLEARLWSPDSPYLYDLEISLVRDGVSIDRVKGYAAMRTISYAADEDGHKRMLLNGKPLFQYGPLDQGWWPDGLYTAPTDEALAFDIEKTKEMGFNLIRKHVKVEPARWYWHCDRLGMLVWQDMPSIADNGPNYWDNRTYERGTDYPVPEEGKANYYKEWGEIINAFKTFPCIVAWVPFNEAWGQFDTEEVVQLTRAQDPSRLINYASGGNFVRCSGDIIDLHNYPHPEMYLYDKDYINVLGEYGGIGWPVEGHLWQPEKNWGYVRFNSADEVLDTYEKYADQLIELVDKGFAAAIYTQTTDVEGEVNGLMTYDRKVMKLNMDRLRTINQRVIESM
ncbi:MAG: beta-galactosidase [Bacteroidales bacterium]|nr:beta-galactosidase [Bacteroidales bacterium]